METDCGRRGPQPVHAKESGVGSGQRRKNSKWRLSTSAARGDVAYCLAALGCRTKKTTAHTHPIDAGVHEGKPSVVTDEVKRALSGLSVPSDLERLQREVQAGQRLVVALGGT